MIAMQYLASTVIIPDYQYEAFNTRIMRRIVQTSPEKLMKLTISLSTNKINNLHCVTFLSTDVKEFFELQRKLCEKSLIWTLRRKLFIFAQSFSLETDFSEKVP